MAVMPLAIAGTLVLAAAPASAAESCPNAKYRTGPSLFLPECRAYELVTPQGKTNVLRQRNTTANMAKVAPDGEGILYLTATGPLTREASAGMNVWETARRGADGWKAESVTPPIVGPFGETANSYARMAVPSAGLDKIFFTSSAVFDSEQTWGVNPTFNGGVFLGNGTSSTWVSKPTWAGALPAQANTDTRWYRFHPVGGTPDLSTVYFNTFATLTPEDEASGRPAMQSLAVYKYENGQLSNAGILPDGSLSPGGSISADRVGNDVNTPPNPLDVDVMRDNAVSSDGSSLLFVSPDPTRAAVDPLLPKPQLYMAVDGKASVLLSAPEGDDAPQAGTTGVEPASNRMSRPNPNLITSAYEVATPDHSVVLFSTKDALTEDAEGVDPEIVKTYRYEGASGSLTYLPDLDRTVTADDAGSNAKFGQIVELSESGDSMLYLTEGGSLRLWRKDKPTLTVSEGVSRSLRGDASYITSARFSADEEVLALNSLGPLRGEPDHTPGLFNPSWVYRAQVYRYTVADDNLDCISCKPGGSLTGAALSVWGPENGYSNGSATPTGYWSARSMTADGSTIYFTTTTPLLEADHNTVEDVYQWRDGKLGLITTGASGADGAALYETTADGRDVFIISAEQLSPSDTDGFYDISDVRVNGGFDPPEAARSCAIGECQGPPPADPSSPTIGSAEFTGLGNRSAAGSPRRRAQPLGVSGAKSVTGTAALLRVRVRSAGRIVVDGSLVKKTTRRVSKAGRYRVRVSLTGPGKLVLAKRSSLRTGLRVSFKSGSTPVATRNMQVTFKQPGAKTSPSASRKGR
jgi:hypothetical protein